MFRRLTVRKNGPTDPAQREGRIIRQGSEDPKAKNGYGRADGTPGHVARGSLR